MKERKKNTTEPRFEPVSPDWQADTLTTQPPRLDTAVNKTYALRTKPGSFKGCNESRRRIFAAALTKVPTAPELHRGVPKVLSVHSIRKLNSTPPFSYYLGNDFSDLTTWLPWLMGTFKGPSKCQYKIKTSRETFGYFGKERGLFARAWPLLLCILFKYSELIIYSFSYW